MKQIGIYYICTGVYKNWFAGFLESLNHFMPKDEKYVFIISDGLDEYTDYESDDKQVKVASIDHIHYYPWPIVTLFKFKYILDNKKSSMDYCFYFNANSWVLEKDIDFWNDLNSMLSKNDLMVTYHAVNASKQSKNDFIKGASIRNKKSTSYIKDQNYFKLQAAFFGGKSTPFYEMCENHLALLTEDLKNNIIAPAADESYFNKYIFENRAFLKIHYQMVIYAEEKGYNKDFENELFVKLRYNDSYKDKKSDKDVRNIFIRTVAKIYHTLLIKK